MACGLYRKCYACGSRRDLKRKSSKGLRMFIQCPKCHGKTFFFGKIVDTFQLRRHR